MIIGEISFLWLISVWVLIFPQISIQCCFGTRKTPKKETRKVETPIIQAPTAAQSATNSNTSGSLNSLNSGSAIACGSAKQKTPNKDVKHWIQGKFKNLLPSRDYDQKTASITASSEVSLQEDSTLIKNLANQAQAKSDTKSSSDNRPALPDTKSECTVGTDVTQDDEPMDPFSILVHDSDSDIGDDKKPTLEASKSDLSICATQVITPTKNKK